MSAGVAWAVLRTSSSPCRCIALGALGLFLPSLPFLFAGTMSYLDSAFDLTRTLVWDKVGNQFLFTTVPTIDYLS